MTSFKQSLTVWLLCIQLLFVSVAGANLSVYDNFHLATAHQLALDHHHHDDLSTRFDHDDGAGTHVHLADSFQPVGLLPETPSKLKPSGANRRLSLSINPPLDIFLAGLLRPPQALL